MGSPRIDIRLVKGEQDMRAALSLREEVFCREQGVPRSEEIDGRDEQALHLVAFARPAAGGQVVGTLRLLFDGELAKIGRVAVDRGWRRRGIALAMLEHAIGLARRDGATRARLAAQVDAVALYQRVGFAIESQVFEEAGIEHVWMGRSLGSDHTAGTSTGRVDPATIAEKTARGRPRGA